MVKKKNKVTKPKPNEKYNPLRTIIIVTVVVLALLALTVTMLTASAPKVAKVGQPAPDFTLMTVDGKQVSLSQFKGKPVIINFWATWCPPCRLEMPALEEISHQAADKGFIILAVDQEEDAATVKSFLTQNQYDYLSVLDINGAVSTMYQVSGIPTSIFVDANGIVREMHSGTMPDAQQFLDKIPY